MQAAEGGLTISNVDANVYRVFQETGLTTLLDVRPT